MIDYAPRKSTEDQRGLMRKCVHSHIDASKSRTPVFLCTKDVKEGEPEKRLPYCSLYGEVYCDHFEKFPERFNN